MFDIVTLKQAIFEHYFKLFNLRFSKKLVKQFIIDWIYYVELYSKMPNFIRFNSDIPVLTNLQPNTKCLMIVPFQNEEMFTNTSVFPICLFTAYYKNNFTLSCKESMQLLLLYLKITNVKYIAFYKVINYKKILCTIKEQYPNIKFYPPSSFYFFCRLNKIYKY